MRSRRVAVRPVTFRLPFRSRVGGEAWPGLELLSTAVLVLDAARTIVYVNPAAENLFEVSRGKLVGVTTREVFGESPGLEAGIARAEASGAAYTEQEQELAVPGKGLMHLTCTVSPIDHPDGALVVELRHIDQQLKIAREERLNEQQHANRELIRNLAHEIKNPLGGIRGAAQLLERELDAPHSEYTQVIIGEADRLQSLVDRLLTPHRMPRFCAVNVHEVLVRVKGVVQAEFPAIPVICDFDISLPELDADPGQLTQAFLNIVRNAAQALNGTTAGPQVTLVTRIARYVTLARRRHPLAVAVAIEDNGPGIAPELRERIFYPLVSGREGGSGLGLTIAQTFVAQHGGAIECESAPGRTRFTVLLPLGGNGHADA
jgi:two-component system nitrogen regulation sensor histidine kinase GlnL